MFLQKVRVSHFVKSAKGAPEFWGNGVRKPGRHLERTENSSPNEVYTIIGKTVLREGLTKGGSYDERNSFEQTKVYSVYVVAKSLGRKYLVLPEDLLLEDDLLLTVDKAAIEAAALAYSGRVVEGELKVPGITAAGTVTGRTDASSPNYTNLSEQAEMLIRAPRTLPVQ